MHFPRQHTCVPGEGCGYRKRPGGVKTPPYGLAKQTYQRNSKKLITYFVNKHYITCKH